MRHSYTYDRYYKYEEITDILKKYESQYPDFVKLTSIGTTSMGRNIWAVEITDLSSGKFEDKPAYYVEANIHAGEVTGSMTVMCFLDTIFTNIQSDEIKKLLKEYTIYAVPRVSPDGSEHYLTSADYVRSVPKMYPYDIEMPGLQKKDMDGDNVARLMRVKTKYGAWKISEKDSRIMEKRAPDDVDGEFYNVYDEGMIEDFDGINIINAPSKFGNDFNRNYPIGWETEDKQAGAGTYPLVNPETKANADFLLNHHNVCFVVDMHTAGGQNLYTPGYKSAKNAIKEDIEIYKALGNMAKQENGYPVLNVFDDYMPASASVTYGGFDDFCHFVLGIPAMTIECWDLNVRAGVEMLYPPKENKTAEEELSDFEKCLKWADENLSQEEGFKPWTEFLHPQLGTVEIGGFNSKFFSQNPPSKFLEQEVVKHTNFMLRAIKTLPKVIFESTEIEKLADGLYRLDVIVGNKGFMPTYVFKEGLKSKSLKELFVKITNKDIEFTQGKAEMKIGQLGGIASVSAHNGSLGAASKQKEPLCKKVTWIIKAKPNTVLDIVCGGGKIGEIHKSITIE